MKLLLCLQVTSTKTSDKINKTLWKKSGSKQGRQVPENLGADLAGQAGKLYGY